MNSHRNNIQKKKKGQPYVDCVMVTIHQVTLGPLDQRPLCHTKYTHTKAILNPAAICHLLVVHYVW